MVIDAMNTAVRELAVRAAEARSWRAVHREEGVRSHSLLFEVECTAPIGGALRLPPRARALARHARRRLPVLGLLFRVHFRLCLTKSFV